MIAPLRQPNAPRTRDARNLTAARRALAAALFRRPRHPVRAARRVSTTVAWAFVAWALAIACLYVTFQSWWVVAMD